MGLCSGGYTNKRGFDASKMFERCKKTYVENALANTAAGNLCVSENVTCWCALFTWLKFYHQTLILHPLAAKYCVPSPFRWPRLCHSLPLPPFAGPVMCIMLNGKKELNLNITHWYDDEASILNQTVGRRDHCWLERCRGWSLSFPNDGDSCWDRMPVARKLTWLPAQQDTNLTNQEEGFVHVAGKLSGRAIFNRRKQHCMRLTE